MVVVLFLYLFCPSFCQLCFPHIVLARRIDSCLSSIGGTIFLPSAYVVRLYTTLTGP